MIVNWAARVLVAAWQRQEIEGRYRGADDFRALHIDPADAVASWRAAMSAQIGWPADISDDFARIDLGAELGLDDAERLVCVLAVAVELEPRLRQLVSALGDDPSTRSPTVALAAEIGPAVGVPAAAVRKACGPDRRLVQYELVRVVAIEGRPSLLDAQLVATDWTVTRAAGTVDGSADLRWTSGAADRGDRLIAVSGADHVRHAEQLATRAAVAKDDVANLGRAGRDARAADALLVVGCTDRPSAELVARCEALAELGGRVALSTEAPVRWVPPPRWRVVDVAPLGTGERAARWSSGLVAAGLPLDPQRVAALARDYRLGAGGVDDAIARTRSGSEPRAAARATAWQDLTDVAHPGPVHAHWADLVVPDRAGAMLREIAAAISARRVVMDEWRFGAQAGGRGYHILFVGPSGTGKTLAAAVIAREVGLELWVVDLARVVDKYLGETEKLLDRVLRSAEVSGSMLLFDEAEALFGRRGEVREARDRWANVEVAYLLQRIEQHDGVTVLTTNASHHIDEAFSRRMSQRVEFPMPDAAMRRVLWDRCMPAATPIRDRRDLDIVGDRFELTGGAIRNAAVNAAYAAAVDGGVVTLRHIVRASVSELVKAGRAPTRAELGDFASLLDRS